VVGLIATAHGLNEGMVRRWIREAKQRRVSGGRATTTVESDAGQGFVAVTLPTGVNVASAPPAALTIHLRCRRGPTLVEMDWPVQAASECAAWLREWLR
jgi:transposase